MSLDSTLKSADTRESSRSRMISFRLTEDEYDRCRELCYSQGLRSVSEMARAGLNLLLEQPGRVAKEALEARVAELEGRLHMLSLELRRLAQPPSLPPVAHNGVDAN